MSLEGKHIVGVKASCESACFPHTSSDPSLIISIIDRGWAISVKFGPQSGCRMQSDPAGSWQIQAGFLGIRAWHFLWRKLISRRMFKPKPKRTYLVYFILIQIFWWPRLDRLKIRWHSFKIGLWFTYHYGSGASLKDHLFQLILQSRLKRTILV